MNAKKMKILYLSTTLFCLLFNYGYSFFGHGVSSPFMKFSFIYSLVLGVGGFTLIAWQNLSNRLASQLFNAGIATLTIGSILKGVIQIAGADTIYPTFYFIVGSLFIVIGMCLFILEWNKKHIDIHTS